MSGTTCSLWFATVARLGRQYWRTFFCVRRPAARPTLPANRHRGWFLTATVLITLAGAGLRASFLNHPMRYDESMVYFEYVVHPLHDLATRYNRVQNHLLHTILEHEAVRVGGNSPPVLRLPAAIAGTALIPLAIALGCAVTRRRAYGLLAGGLVAVSSVLVDYSANARGYTMVCVFTLSMCLCTLGLVRQPRRRRLWLLWALLGTLGAFTIPTMLLPVAGLAVVIVLDAAVARHPRRRRVQLVRLAVTLGTCGLLTFLLYVPVVVRTGLFTMLAARHAVHHYAQAYFSSPAYIARMTWQDWTRDATLSALLLLGLGLVLGLVRALRQRSAAWAVPWGMLIVGVFLAVLLPVQPYPRLWLYLLPVVLTFGACGLVLIEPRALRRLAVAVMVASVTAGGYQVSRREFLAAENPPTLVDAELVADACADWPDREFGLIMLPITPAVHYYAHRRNLPRPAHPIDPRVRTTYVVVNGPQSLEDVLAAKGGTWLAEYGTPFLYKTLPHSRIYRMERMNSTNQVAGVIGQAKRDVPD